jgi:hypothetical protein
MLPLEFAVQPGSLPTTNEHFSKPCATSADLSTLEKISVRMTPNHALGRPSSIWEVAYVAV